jgi:quercetin dioxygenase-like cupin family protein
MRQIITGVDADGRSCVVAEHPIDARRPDRSRMISTFHTAASPPSRPPGRGEHVDLEVPVGATKLMLAQWSADFSSGMHQTDTIDFDTVLEGSATLVLEDGRHHLGVGDVAVVMGVDHAWEAGPEGTTISFVFLGTPAPED